jgi:hypothetical protein
MNEDRDIIGKQYKCVRAIKSLNVFNTRSAFGTLIPYYDEGTIIKIANVNFNTNRVFFTDGGIITISQLDNFFVPMIEIIKEVEG